MEEALVARMTIYLPDELHSEIKASKLAVSRICQEALREALGAPAPGPRKIVRVPIRKKVSVEEMQRLRDEEFARRWK
jgi:hypothetical protein